MLALYSYLATISLIVFIAQLLVSLLIAIVSIIGYTSYRSNTLLYLSASFFLIALGVSSQSIYQTNGSAFLQLFGAISETAGYFILAISHVYTVRSSIMTPSLSLSFALMLPSSFLIYTVIKSVSFFLLLYIFAETAIFAIQNKSKAALIPSAGFLLLTFSTYTNLFLNTLTFNLVLIEIAKLLGFLILAAPLTVFVLRRGHKGS
jgi:hypothetical protein